MPNTTPPARYDVPWKAALSHAFHAFMDFFFAELSATIDWSQRPRFRDKELARIGFGDAPDVMVADKLIEVRLRDGSHGWMLIHVEVQAQRDAKLAQRVFDYNSRISKEYERPVISLVILADEDPNWRPNAFHREQPGTAMHFSFSTAKLLDYAARSDELMASDNPTALVVLAHLRTQQAHHNPDELYAAKWELTKLLFLHRWDKKRIIVLFKVINWMMVLPQPHQRRYWRAVLQLDKEHNMELMNPLEQMFFDDGVESGLKRGLEQGIEQGRKEGAAALLERLLIRRFGPLPQTVRNKLANASIAQLDAWSDALSEAPSVKQLFR